MRKKSSILAFSLLIFLYVGTTINPVYASIEQFAWLPMRAFKGLDDSIYQVNIIAYEENTTASLFIPVYNDAGTPINVSAVKAEFDWGINYTSSEASADNPIQIQKLKTHAFVVNFTVPLTEIASNAVAHTFKIYVEQVNATSGPKSIVNTWTANWDSWAPAYKFVVFSADQADANDLNNEYQAYYNAFTLGGFSSNNASTVAGQARAVGELGQQSYTSGDFSSAKSQLQNAINLYIQAITFERKYAESSQEAQVNQTIGYAYYYEEYGESSKAQATYYEAQAKYIEAQADYYKTYYAAQADYYKAYADMYKAEVEYYKAYADSLRNQGVAALNQSYAWILFGVALTITSVGLFLLLSRRSRVP